MPPPPAAPTHTLRIHAAAVNTLSISHDNERIYAGDLAGTVSVTSTRTLRAITSWKAHADGILAVQEWDAARAVITHGRDNKLHVWERVLAPPSLGDSATRPDLPIPALRYSLDVNALNFCRFSLLDVTEAPVAEPLHSSSPSGEGLASSPSALLAVPNLVESSLADIWELPSCERLHAAIGKAQSTYSATKGRDGRADAETGILMALHVFSRRDVSAKDQLHLLAAYEAGSVALYQYDHSSTSTSVSLSSRWGTSIEGRGWVSLWRVRKHVESVMAMAMSRDNTLALTVSADHLVVRYDLGDSAVPKPEDASRSIPNETIEIQTEGAKAASAESRKAGDVDDDPRFSRHRIKHAGNASVAIRDDGRVCAVGGWDGKIRLFSTKSLKPLGTLAYHSKNCQALAFAHPVSSADSVGAGLGAGGVGTVEDDNDLEDELTREERKARSRWVVAGSQDCRISVWELASFERPERGKGDT